MRPTEKIEKIIRKFEIDTNAQKNQVILDELLQAQAKSKGTKLSSPQPNMWRTIMNSRLSKSTAAVVIIIAAMVGIRSFDGTRAWGIEQTVKALEEIKTIVITGTDRWGSASIPFKFWIRFSEDNDASFDMRFESEKQKIVIHGTKAWAYRHDENIVKVYEDITTSKGMMQDIGVWYKAAELNPWITGKVLATLKLFADDWQEIYEKDKQTGRDCAFVTCSYKPLSLSFWFACDVETKLIVEGKYWKNAGREGQPVCHALSFTYNDEISEEIFKFKIPEAAKVINRGEQRKADALFIQGEKLFEEKETIQAIRVFQQVYENYPNLNIAESALMMIGICYERLKQYKKAIETYEKSIREYRDLKGWIESTYFYLGRAYLKNGQKNKALVSFQNCLIIGEGVRGPDRFPLKQAREYIDKIKCQD